MKVLGRELDLSRDLQEKKGSEDLNKYDPLNILENSKTKSEEITDMFEPKEEADENLKSIYRGG